MNQHVIAYLAAQIQYEESKQKAAALCAPIYARHEAGELSEDEMLNQTSDILFTDERDAIWEVFRNSENALIEAAISKGEQIAKGRHKKTFSDLHRYCFESPRISARKTMIEFALNNL